MVRIQNPHQGQLGERLEGLGLGRIAGGHRPVTLALSLTSDTVLRPRACLLSGVRAQAWRPRGMLEAVLHALLHLRARSAG